MSDRKSLAQEMTSAADQYELPKDHQLYALAAALDEASSNYLRDKTQLEAFQVAHRAAAVAWGNFSAEIAA